MEHASTHQQFHVQSLAYGCMAACTVLFAKSGPLYSIHIRLCWACRWCIQACRSCQMTSPPIAIHLQGKWNTPAHTNSTTYTALHEDVLLHVLQCFLPNLALKMQYIRICGAGRGCIQACKSCQKPEGFPIHCHTPTRKMEYSSMHQQLHIHSLE